MARTPKSMRHIHEVLRLKHQHALTVREIARSSGLPPSTVGDYLQRFEAAGLTWPLPEGLSETALQDRLLGHSPAAPAPPPNRPMPDWRQIHNELRRKNVTRQLLWQEYQQTHPEGYSYSRFCELYQAWAHTLEPVLRQVHEPGEKLFVDWAGQRVPICNATDGSLTEASLFVAALGASNKTFAEAFPNPQLSCWIAGRVHAWTFYGGVARLTIPDYVPRHIMGVCSRPRYVPSRAEVLCIWRSRGHRREHNVLALGAKQSSFLRSGKEIAMLEKYFVKPQTIDRIRADWLGEPIERYVAWLHEQGYGGA